MFATAAVVTPPAQEHRDPKWGHRIGEGATIDFVGGRIDIVFKPYAGSLRAVLSIRCEGGRCAAFRDPELLVPIQNAPHLRVRFRPADGQLISTTALSRLPHESMLSFMLGGRRHTLRVR